MELNNISFENIKLLDGFWKERYNLNANVSINSVYERFKDTNRFNVINKLSFNPDVESHIFFDSDTAKWLEAVGYILSNDRANNTDLEEKADKIIDDFAKLQSKSGYVNSYYQRHKEKRFSNRNNHELYCLGHLIEASIAYERATGKNKLFKVVDKYIDYVIERFTVKKNTGFITPGHEEIELALFKLYQEKKDEKYKKLAEFFINNRGVNKEYTFEPFTEKYFQSDIPIRKMTKVTGHSVRAMYLFSAVCDMAKLNNDQELYDVCQKIWDDTISKMYVTGGIGSYYMGECFTIPYDLPNSKAYAESCACIALMLFASRMQKIENKAEYAEVIERILYNNLLSTTSLDGKAFFYENPLEIDLDERNRDESISQKERFPDILRQEIFGCSCCPPNITRTIASIANYIYTISDDAFILQQWIASSLKYQDTSIDLVSDYPNETKAKLTIKNYTKPLIMLRIPPFFENLEIKKDGQKIDFIVKDGYVSIKASLNFVLDINFEMHPRYIYANPKAKEDIGMSALSYGPIIYALEGIDNGDLSLIGVDVTNKVEFLEKGITYFKDLKTIGYLQKMSKTYSYEKPQLLEKTLRFIPYYAFANRGKSNMKVFIPRIIK